MANIKHSDEWMAGWKAALAAMERLNSRKARLTNFERHSLLSEHDLGEMREQTYREHPEQRPPLEKTAKGY